MKPTFALLACFALAISSARAENSVVVESMTFYAGQKDRVVGVHVVNDDYLQGITLPFELRELTPGAYPAARFTFEENPTGRIHFSPLGSGFSPPAGISRRRFPVPEESNSCSGPVSHTYKTNTISIDYQSPDATCWAAVSWDEGTYTPMLEPGSDPPGTENASYRFRFDLSSTPGQFEIDTCCVFPGVHIFLANSGTVNVLSGFTKGVITIAPCSCPCAADPVCDGVYDINDVSTLVDVAFRGEPDIGDSTCTVSRTDVNADGKTDVVDVVRMIFVAFLGQPPEMYFVNPCQ